MTNVKPAPSLKQLEEIFLSDTSLPLAAGNNPVFGEGSQSASILAIGEAPGFHENQEGRPFVGRSGKLLRRLLSESGIDPESIYITNVVKHRPPENRDPTEEEIEAYRPYLDRQIELIRPKIIVTLGRFSMNKFLPRAKISMIHGQAHWLQIAGQKTMVIPMFHPAAALRGTTVMNQFKEDFVKLKNALEYFETMGTIPSSIEKVNESNPQKTTQLSLIN